LTLTRLKMPWLFGACYSEPNALVKIYAKQLMPCRVPAIRGRFSQGPAHGNRRGARHSSPIISWRLAAGLLGRFDPAYPLNRTVDTRQASHALPIETRRLSLCEAVR
jgi:hypothetical protein